MKYLIALSILTVMSFARVEACTAQNPLNKMTEEELVACGLNKLTDEEKASLHVWLNKNTKSGKKNWKKNKWQKNKTVAPATIASIDLDKRAFTDHNGVQYKMHPHSAKAAQSLKAGDQVTVITNGRWSKVKQEGVKGKIWAKAHESKEASSSSAPSPL